MGYLLGSIPFGLILTRYFGAGDLRAIGSGNIGATNVLRTGRKGLAAATLLLDAAKGAIAVLIGAALVTGGGALAAVGVFFGHLYPVWLNFRGGKGVATLFGIAIAANWICGLIYAVIWIGALVITRTSSLGGMSAAIALPVVAAVIGRFDLVVLFLIFTLMVLWKHRENIMRLLAGTEPRIGESKDPGEGG
ncbi:glycerol-3-phosphate 1-O-acyltransferase PlsY [Sphingomonas cavernae]|uniref:Glycerol-3-phosphate acyltransferase n=1 Tax=Sphingomonas cavernae TaxID=2320861 RepID=A0A418WNH8_9SPHN|nr:glycerol-3-phosphate 1-O-acyltransferase PlsY [Sphingomonas cavernae]RJF91550.1 glycerol-3-phosphate 1-O-acyltransferase [Sphingomonas cavernae]